MMSNTALPTKPSDLIRLALHDLAIVEVDERYNVNMGTWHSGAHGGIPCRVCLAGAVMANTLDVRPDRTEGPSSMGAGLFGPLNAINSLREGDAGCAFDDLGISSNLGSEFDREIADYHEEPERFLADMEDFADALEEEGY